VCHTLEIAHLVHLFHVSISGGSRITTLVLCVYRSSPSPRRAIDALAMVAAAAAAAVKTAVTVWQSPWCVQNLLCKARGSHLAALGALAPPGVDTREKTKREKRKEMIYSFHLNSLRFFSSFPLFSFLFLSSFFRMSRVDVEVEVTWEDQKNINAFGRLNGHMHEIEDEIVKKKEELLNLEEASNELILLDDDEPVRFKMGEIFVEVPKEEAEQMIERATTQASEEVDALGEKVTSIKKTLAELKVKLYGKFGSAINLEE